MKDIYIKATDVNKWVAKHFKNQDLISIDDLISCIDELDDEIENLNDKIRKLTEPSEEDYYEQWRDHQLEKEE